MLHRSTKLATATILALLAVNNLAMAQRGGRGGGGGARGGGGMVSRGGGGGGFSRPQNFARPSAPQNFNRPNNVNQNFNRPNNVNQNFNRPNNVNQNFNRPTNVNQNVNRPTNVNNNINRPTNVNNNNINNRQNVVNNVNVNNINNVNRGRYDGYGAGHGNYGGVNRNWGVGGYGGGVHANTYYGYHSNWVHGAWGGNYRPYYGGYGYGGYRGYGGYGNYGYPGYGYGFGTGLGIGAGLGIAAWGVGSLFNNWGYSAYNNPYYNSGYAQQGFVSQTGGYNYGVPLNLAASPPDEQVVQTAELSFDSARDAFRAGDYNQALAQTDKSLTQTPNDPMLHEFRATTLFAMNRYDESAAAFYTVLSAGPGWDWTTLIGLYPDIDTYTGQLRALESFCNANPRAASARFVLASLYLTQGSNDAAATRFREVIAIQPQDKLSAQLLAAITAESAGPAQGQPPAVAANDTPPANPSAAEAPKAPPLPTGPIPANLVGVWTATPAKDVTITLTVGSDKSFNWKVTEKGQTREFKGEPGYDADKNILALVPPDMPPMVGEVALKDAAHFHFKAVGTPAEDPGLDFVKS